MRSGSVERRGRRLYIRVRLGGGRRPRYPTHLSEAEANVRAKTVANLANKLLAAGKSLDLVDRFARKAADAPESELALLVKTAADVTADRLVDGRSHSGWRTFGELADAWCSGKIATLFPDYDKRRPQSVEKAAQILARHVLPHVRDVPLELFTIDHAQRVMQMIPSSRSSATRRHVAQTLSRILKLAVFPCRLIPVSPLPAGFLPRVRRERVSGFLYPAEDKLLMAFAGVALVERLFYGILAREGLRESELHRLEWRDIDLENGTIRLDTNKTDDARAWPLDAGVREALSRYRTLRGDLEPDSRVLVGSDGQPISIAKMARRFRSALQRAGVLRHDLHDDTAHRQPTRVHDLRVAFVSIALANGKTEAFVTARTGHRSSAMIARYQRRAQTVAELGLGTWEPLYLAIPELAAFGLAPSWPTTVAKGGDATPTTRGSRRSQPFAPSTDGFKISGS